MDGYPNVSGIGLASGPVRDVLLGSQLQPSPAAGADFSYTIPDAGAIYEIVAARARLVTSAAVANRVVAVLVKDASGNEVFRAAFDTAITASLTTIFTFTPTAGAVNGGLTNGKALTFPLPPGPYLPRWTISTSTAAIDTADQWSQVAVWYRQLFLGAAGPES